MSIELHDEGVLLKFQNGCWARTYFEFHEEECQEDSYFHPALTVNDGKVKKYVGLTAEEFVETLHRVAQIRREDKMVEAKEEAKPSVLIGNTWPMTLVRSEISIVPISYRELYNTLRKSKVFSFWGHKNTLEVVRKQLGLDLTPKEERPAVNLSPLKYPVFQNEVFKTVYVVNPTYVDGFRPAIGEEVTADKIEDWVVLRIQYL